jgi:molybdopterin synthase catalytic subunit
VAIVHRLGEVPAGEASVAIAVAAPHRAAAYAASRRALERLKAEAPIWKLERYADGGSRWREEESLLPAASSPVV